MFKRLFESFGRSQKPPRVPEGELVYAIGDIHGRLDLLRALEARILEHAGQTPATRRVLVYIGDYIDRGPDSAGVVEHLVQPPPPGFERILLRGNHEQFLSDFLQRPAQGIGWISNGGLEALLSYGVRMTAEMQGADMRETLIRLSDELRARLPDSHLAFFDSLQPWYRLGDYLFVHAGIRPGIPFEQQAEADMLWIRQDFLDSREDHGFVVVHGHTPVEQPELLPNRIAIDTGAFASDCLTALALYGSSRDLLQTATPD